MSALTNLARDRSAQFTLLIAVAGLIIYGFGAPQIPALTAEVSANLANEYAQMPLSLILLAIVYLMTRNRPPIDFVARSPEHRTALVEVIGLIVYGVVAIFGLAALGITYHPPDVFEPGIDFSGTRLMTWAIINFVIYGAIPYLFFRWRGSSNVDLGLAGNNWVKDIWLILVIGGVDLILALQFTDFLTLTPGQMVTSVPLAFILYTLGAGVPVVIMVQAIFTPRLMRLTNSTITTTIYVAFAYALFSASDAGIVFESGGHAFYALLYAIVHNIGPGLIKAILTVRTGNSWLHMFAYHVLSFHAFADAVTVAFLFGL
ncbi:MAG: hypothetical protein AAF702_00245 [Chloroflexota bacterium]